MVMFLTNTFSFTVTEFWGTLPQVNSQYQSGQPLCFGLSIRKGALSLCLLSRKISGCLLWCMYKKPKCHPHHPPSEQQNRRDEIM